MSELVSNTVTNSISSSQISKVIWSSWIGNSIEFYDFSLFGLFSALVFNQVFFSSLSPISGILASFAAFAVGFIARPLGGIVFGHFGDTLGRKKVLFITLGGMGLSTFLIGVLPTYHQIGLAAPIILVVLRFVQGLLVGGEWGGAMIMAVESAPKNRRGFFGAIPQTGGFSSQIILFAIFLILKTSLSQEQMLTWGWRIPFLISIILVFIGLWIRKSLDESVVFQTIQKAIEMKKKKTFHSPILEVLRTNWCNIILLMLLRFAESVPYFLSMVFIISYAPAHLGTSTGNLSWIILVTSVIAFPAHFFFGSLSDKLGRRPVYIFGSLFVAVITFPFFWLMQTGITVCVLLAYILIINIGHNSINAVQPAFFTETFPTKMRYSGASLGSQFGAIIAGGFTPYIATYLTSINHWHYTYLAFYVMITAIVSAISAYILRETSKKDLHEE